LVEAATPLEAGQQVDGLQIVRELGRGAYGIVYLAKDILLGRLDRWSDEKTKKKVAELVDRNLVRDAELGTSLLEFCRERGWELAIE
jgi:serine/threonine protein kinase